MKNQKLATSALLVIRQPRQIRAGGLAAGDRFERYLDEGPVSPEARAWRQTGKFNVLYFSPFPSHPANHGNQATIQQFGKRFQSLGHKVHFALLESPMYGAEAERGMREMWDTFDILPNTKPLWSNGSEIPFDGWYDERVEEEVRFLCALYDIDLVFCSYVFQSRLYVQEIAIRISELSSQRSNRSSDIEQYLSTHFCHEPFMTIETSPEGIIYMCCPLGFLHQLENYTPQTSILCGAARLRLSFESRSSTGAIVTAADCIAAGSPEEPFMSETPPRHRTSSAAGNWQRSRRTSRTLFCHTIRRASSLVLPVVIVSFWRTKNASSSWTQSWIE